MITDLIKKTNSIFHVIITFMARFSSAIYMFLLTVMVARQFGPEGKGIIALVVFLPDFLYFLLHLGLGNASIYFLSSQKEDEKKVFNNAFWQGLGLSLIAIIGVLIISIFVPHILGIGVPMAFVYIALLMTPFSFWETFFENILAGKQEFHIFNMVIIIDRFLMIIALCILIFIVKINLLTIALVLLINYIIKIITYLIILIKRYGFPNLKTFDKVYFKKAFNFGLRSYLACLLCYLVLRSDLYMLSVMKGITEVGYYSVATNLIDSFLLLSGSFSAVIFPLMSKNIKHGIYYTKKISSLVSMFSLLIIGLSLLLGKSIIMFFYGKLFMASVTPLFILLIAMYFWSVLSIITQFFAANNFPWKAVLVWIPGVLGNIVLNLIYIPRYGMIAAALSSVFAYSITFFLHVLIIQKYEKVTLKDLMIPKFDCLKNWRNTFKPPHE